MVGAPLLHRLDSGLNTCSKSLLRPFDSFLQKTLPALTPSALLKDGDPVSTSVVVAIASCMLCVDDGPALLSAVE